MSWRGFYSKYIATAVDPAWFSRKHDTNQYTAPIFCFLQARAASPVLGSLLLLLLLLLSLEEC